MLKYGWLDSHLSVGPLQCEEVQADGRVDPALEDELVRHAAADGVRRVLHVAVDARLDHPLVVERRESTRLVKQLRDEIVSPVRLQLKIWNKD